MNENCGVIMNITGIKINFAGYKWKMRITGENCGEKNIVSTEIVDKKRSVFGH